MNTFFSCDFTPAQTSDFVLNSCNNYDIACIEHFIHNPMPSCPMNDDERHSHLMETRNRLDHIINAIKNYDNEDKENPTTHLEDN